MSERFIELTPGKSYTWAELFGPRDGPVTALMSPDRVESTGTTCQFSWCLAPATVRLPTHCPECKTTANYHGCPEHARSRWLDYGDIACARCGTLVIKGEPVNL